MASESDVLLCTVNSQTETRLDSTFHRGFKASILRKITQETDVIITVDIACLFLLLMLSFVSHHRIHLFIFF